MRNLCQTPGPLRWNWRHGRGIVRNGVAPRGLSFPPEKPDQMPLFAAVSEHSPPEPSPRLVLFRSPGKGRIPTWLRKLASSTSL